MAQVKATNPQALQALDQDYDLVIPDKGIMEQVPSQANMAVLRQMAEAGLIDAKMQAATVMIYLTVAPDSLKYLKVIHLIEAAERVLNGEKLGEHFYLIPKLGVYTSKRGMQRKLGLAGLPAPRIVARLMTEAERALHDLDDPEEHGSIVTMTWDDLHISVEGAGVVNLSKMYGNSMLIWPKDGSQDRRPTPAPRNQWRLVAPPEGKSWAWVAQKRAERDALNKMDGFKFVQPAERVQAGRELGLPMIGEQVDGFINTAQAKAAIDAAVAQAALAYRDRQIIAVLGQDAYEKLIAESAKAGQIAMRGDPAADPFDAIEAGADRKAIAGPAPAPAPADDTDDFDEVAAAAVVMAADFDILTQLQDSEADLVKVHPEWAGAATDAQVTLWNERCAEAIADVSEAKGSAGVLLVTARLCRALPATAADADFRPLQAQVRAWMRAWLVPAKPFMLTPEGKQAILTVHAEALKAWHEAGA